MNPFKIKRYFNSISTLVVTTYITLCITSGGFHSFDKSIYHGHNLKTYDTHRGHIECRRHQQQENQNRSSLCFHDHNADTCDICQWLKSSPSKIQIIHKRSPFFQDCSKLCIIDLESSDFLKINTKSPRSPPYSIS